MAGVDALTVLEVVALAAPFLPLRDILAILSTCRHLRTHLYNEYIWERQCVRHFSLHSMKDDRHTTPPPLQLGQGISTEREAEVQAFISKLARDFDISYKRLFSLMYYLGGQFCNVVTDGGYWVAQTTKFHPQKPGHPEEDNWKGDVMHMRSVKHPVHGRLIFFHKNSANGIAVLRKENYCFFPSLLNTEERMAPPFYYIHCLLKWSWDEDNRLTFCPHHALSPASLSDIFALSTEVEKGVGPVREDDLRRVLLWPRGEGSTQQTCLDQVDFESKLACRTKLTDIAQGVIHATKYTYSPEHSRKILLSPLSQVNASRAQMRWECLPSPPPSPSPMVPMNGSVGEEGGSSSFGDFSFLEGIWHAEYASHGTEILQLSFMESSSEFGDSLTLEGLKLAGDVNVPSGQRTFVVDMSTVQSCETAFIDCEEGPVLELDPQNNGGGAKMISMESIQNDYTTAFDGKGIINVRPLLWKPQYRRVKLVVNRNPLRLAVLWGLDRLDDPEDRRLRHMFVLRQGMRLNVAKS